MSDAAPVVPPEEPATNGRGPGRPPNVPPTSAEEEAAIEATVATLLGEDGKLDKEAWDQWTRRLRVKWAARLDVLIGRANGKDAVELIKLGQLIINEPPRGAAGKDPKAR